MKPTSPSTGKNWGQRHDPMYEDKLKAETAGELMKAVLGKLGLLRRGSNRSQETDDSGS